MKKTIGFYEFRNEFDSVRPDNFTYEGLSALYDYLTEYEESTGEEFELDVIALCCDFTEYENIEEVKGSYPNIESIDGLRDNTTVIEFDNGLIIQNY